MNFTIVAKPAQAIIPAVKVDKPIVVAGVQGPPGVSEFYRLRLSTNMTAGVTTYTLPSQPAQPEILVLINGVATEHSISGVNLTITGLTAGEIEDSDTLKVFY